MKDRYVENEAENTNNYLALMDMWRLKYLELNRKELAKRFALESTQKAHYIVYFNEKYRIDQENGMISLCTAPERELSFNTAMAIYHLFYFSKPYAAPSGIFVPFRDVKRAAPFEEAYKKTILKEAAEKFDGRLSELKTACEALGGVKIKAGDAGYMIRAFKCMPLEFIFWEGDDEFASQANILFDSNITDFIHEETVVVIAGELIRRISEEMNLQAF